MRIVIVEDDQILRENLKLLLGGDEGIEVVGAFGSAEDALLKLEKSDPEVLLVDLGLPGMTGIEFIREAREIISDLDIMAHTIFEDRETIFSAIKAGASGYLLKGTRPVELIGALYNLHSGGAPMSPKIARTVIREFQEDGINEQYLLTPREKEVLTGIEKGMSYKELAEMYDISPHTVHTHIKNIYEKLHARDRKDAIVKARKKGII